MDVHGATEDGFASMLSALGLQPPPDASAEVRTLALDLFARRFSGLLKAGCEEGIRARLVEQTQLEALVLLSLPSEGLRAAWEEELALVARNRRVYQETLESHGGFRELQELAVNSTLDSKIGIQNHSGSGSAWMIRSTEEKHFFTCIADNYGLEVSQARLRKDDGAVVSTGKIQFKFPYPYLGLRPKANIREMTIPASHLARAALIRETFLTERQAVVLVSR